MELMILLAAMASVAAGQCSFPDELIGEWTSSNYGTLTFSSSTPQFTMSFGVVDGTSTTSFDCLMIDGTQYILKTLSTIVVFVGTSPVYIYLCLDLRKAGPYSYYYYQNSVKIFEKMRTRFGNISLNFQINFLPMFLQRLLNNRPVTCLYNSNITALDDVYRNFSRLYYPEIGVGGERMVGKSEAITSVNASDICTTTLNTAEFHTMVKAGFESEAAIQCADPLLLSATYVYTDSTGTYCSGLNTTLADTCSNNLTTILFNDSVVTDTGCKNKNPGYSSSGALGCVANVYSSNTSQTYISLYNYDTTLTSSVTYRFTCVAVIKDENGTVHISMVHTDCKAGQSATDLPANGALMELTPFLTCVPVTNDEKNWLWLIILCSCLFGLIIIAIIILICLCMKQKKRLKAREKGMLGSDKHPLGEISLKLDAPSTLEKISNTALLELRDEMYSTPRGRKRERPMKNPMPEPSLILDLKSGKWSNIQKPISTIIEDPFNEMSKDERVPVNPVGHTAARGLRRSRPWSLNTAALKSKGHNPLINGGLPNRKQISNGTFVVNKPTYQSVASEKPEIKRASSVILDGPFAGSDKTPANTLEEHTINLKSVLPEKMMVERASTVETVLTHTGSAKPQIESIKPQTKAPGFRTGRSFRNNNSRSLISWTGKRLNRSHSNVGDKFKRGLTSTMLGSVTNRQTSRREEMVQRSRSFAGSPVSAVEKFTDSEKQEGTAVNDLVSTEKEEDRLAIPLDPKPILKKTSAYLPIETENEENLYSAPRQIPGEYFDPYGYTDSEMLSTTIDVESTISNAIDQQPHLNSRSKTDLSKKASIPTASRAPWR